MGELWTKIVGRTDELLRTNERALPIFKCALAEVQRICGSGAYVQLGPLKDPVRIHEKAMDDYQAHFDDRVLAEANVLDVVRARLVLVEGSGVLPALELLKRGLDVQFEGSTARLELVRCKGKFAQHDTPHFRNALLNLSLVHQGQQYFAELQVHQKCILDYQEEAHAHDHYEFFRERLMYKKAGQGLDFVLEQRMQVFAEISRTPVLLSMLVVCLGESAGGSALPKDIFELYDMTVHAVAHRYDRGKVAVMVRLLQASRAFHSHS